MDAADPLSRFRDAFVRPDPSIYLAGNSLGPLPLAAAALVLGVTELRGGGLAGVAGRA